MFMDDDDDDDDGVGVVCGQTHTEFFTVIRSHMMMSIVPRI